MLAGAVSPIVIAVAIMLLVGFPVHEFSHALAAYRLGDGTAKLFGRLTLNPVAHFDPLGGILLAVTFIGSQGSFGFGWAKPTPVNPMNLQGGRRGEAIVAAAGPISNLILAAIVALPAALPHRQPGPARPGPGDRPPDDAHLHLHQPRPDGLQPVPDPAARRLQGPLRASCRRGWPGSGARSSSSTGFILLLLVFFLPPGDSIGGRIIGPILDGLFALLVGI